MSSSVKKIVKRAKKISGVIVLFLSFISLIAVFAYFTINGKSQPITPQITQAIKERFPAETLDLRDTAWEQNEFSGSILNHGDKDVFNVKIQLSVSKSANQWIPEDQFLTIPYKIKVGETLQFTELVNSSGGSSWWSSYISDAQYYNGEKVPTPPVIAQTIPQQQASGDTAWGVAKQISEHTWTMKVGQDARIATSQEIFEALNNYRHQHGKGTLTWDDNLATFAQTRATYLNSIQDVDEHKGFIEYTKDKENLKKLGFWGVGENCNYGQRLLGVHLIEWVYAGDKPHDDNQLDPTWTHVGIGVNGLGVSLIFGKWEM